jgi:hypothetical protein
MIIFRKNKKVLTFRINLNIMIVGEDNENNRKKRLFR